MGHLEQMPPLPIGPQSFQLMRQWVLWVTLLKTHLVGQIMQI